MLKLCTVVVLLFLCLFTSAQVTGKLTDTASHIPVNNAVVALLQPSDSLLLGFTRTDANGRFSLKSPKPGDYLLITMHPQYADFADKISVSGNSTIYPSISLTSKTKLMEGIVVNSARSIRVKGDTTIFTADSFKVSANANVEELLKKLPGLQVDKDGKITAMGTTVEKVLVDGEEFFGDDPGMAVKNLRADGVKEVQIFDKKSDQAEFTGIDDGKTQKTINLKLKENAKHGYFGKADLSGGLLKDRDDRYNNNLLASNFKGKRKISGFLLNGNTNQDGLSWEDRDKYGGGNDMQMSEDGDVMFFISGGGGDDEPYINTDNGFVKNLNGGASYSNKWNDKQTLNFSPQFNSQIYDNKTLSYTQQQLLQDSVLNTNRVSQNHVNRNNIKLSGNYEIKIDSANTLKFTGKANFYQTESQENSTSAITGGNGNLKNSTNKYFATNTDKQAIGGTVLFKHKFDKIRRTFSLKGDINQLNSTGNNNLISENIGYIAGTLLNVNQNFITNKNSTNIIVNAIYTEPIGKKYAIELSHQYSRVFGTNDQLANSFNAGNEKYDVAVDSLTNDFKQNITENRPGTKLSYMGKKIKWYAGSSFGFTKFDFTDRTFNKDYNRNFTNLYPTAGLTYSYKSNHSLRINYNGNTRQPSLNQLQPLRNNNDQFNLYIGNPNLKQSFTNSINISLNAYDFMKGRYTYLSVNASAISNDIINKSTVDAAKGTTTSQPVNVSGDMNIGLYSGIGFKPKKLGVNINISPSMSYNRRAVILNNNQAYANNTSARLGIGLNKSKEKKYDISLNNQFAETFSNNGLNNEKINYFVNSLQADVTVYYKKVWSLQTNYQFTARQKTAQSNNNLNYNLLNATAKRTFSNDKFTLYLTVRDILNQNKGVEQYVSGNFYSETLNDRLKRYFLLGFRWDFKNKTAVASKN